MKKKIISLILALALCLSALPFGGIAMAAGNIEYIDANGEKRSCDSATDVTANDGTWNGGWYYASGTIAINRRVIVNGDVHLILADGAELTVSGGIGVNEGNSFIIYAQAVDADAMGSLTVTNVTDYNAGIGGTGTGKNSGAVTINGGIVTANGGEGSTSGAAGIGGGYMGSGSHITISGGVVKAYGSDGSYGGGAGIGGGCNGSGSNITITGGDVTATGGDNAAGIGGGYGSNTGSIAAGNVTVSGGDTVAKGGMQAFSTGPAVQDSFADAKTWHGDTEAAAAAAGARPVTELATNYTQKYVRIAAAYDITFNANGGTFADDTAETTLITGADGKLASLPDEPTRTNHDFKGWFDAQTGGNEVTVTTDAVFSSNKTVYAQWEGIASITITTQPQNDSVTEGSISGNLSVTASVLPGGMPAYQWYSCMSADKSGAQAIPGATGARFTIPTDLTQGTYYYFCRVSAEGAADVDSNVATVTVTAGEVIVEPHINEDFDDSDIPQQLKDKGFDTVEKIEIELKTKITQKESGVKGTALYDVILMYSVDGGVTWTLADETHFPVDGKLSVRLPIPEGTDPAKHEYIVAHMFTSDAFGKTPGEVECPEVTVVQKDGKWYLEFYVTGLSPISVGWTEKAASPAPTPEPGGVLDTGDDSNMGLWIALMIVAVSALIICAVLWRRKRTE